MGSILTAAPLDLVDLLLDFKGFEVVKFGFMRLKFRVELVFASLFLFEVISLAHGQHSWLRHTVSFRSNRTTLPPLSPVAR